MSGGSGAGGLEVPVVGPEPRKEVMEGRGAGAPPGASANSSL